MRREPMLPQVDPLPRADCALAVGNRQAQVVLREYAADVCRHVGRAFRRLGKHRVTVRRLALHEGFEVPAHGGIRVLAEHQRCAGVAQEDMTDAGPDTGLADCSLNVVAQIVGPAHWLTTKHAIIGSFELSVQQVINGLIMATLVAMVIIGGIRRIGRVTGYLAPIMAAIYVLATVIIILANIDKVPSAIGMIFGYAFNPPAEVIAEITEENLALKKGRWP